jgi:hypothetical protein
MEAWRRWRYKRFVDQRSGADDFAKFEEWASGPWTPAIAAKIPMPELLAGPPMGAIDNQTRKVIDLELSKRYRSISPIIANIISLSALIVASFALFLDGVPTRCFASFTTVARAAPAP